jgi:hypothetical protein
MQHLCVRFLYETLSVLIILLDNHVICFFAVFVCMFFFVSDFVSLDNVGCCWSGFFFLQRLCVCFYMSDFVSFHTVGCCWSSVFRSICVHDFMCIILLVVIELSVVLIMYKFFEENNEIMKNESILVNGLKTHDSWNMCLCSLQTRALKSGTCQQPNFSKLQKPNVWFLQGLSVTGVVKEKTMWCRVPKECRHDIFFFPFFFFFLLMSVSQSQLIVVFCTYFTKSVDCHVLRLFLVTYDNCDISCFCQLTTKLTHSLRPPAFFFCCSFPSIQFSAAAATTTDIGSW